MLTTDQKGAIAELAIALAATKLGIDVYRPVAEGGRYDLILDSGSDLVRVQCKWAVRVDGVVAVRCYSSRRTLHGIVSRPYTAAQVDALAVYCAELDRCYLVPIALCDGRRMLHLRLVPSRNNQRSGIHWARDFELERLRLADRGAVAQLGERLAGSQKATGSSPVGSITPLRARSVDASLRPGA